MKKLTILYAIIFLVLLTAGIFDVNAYPRVIVSGFEIKEKTAEVGKDATLILNLTNVDPMCAVDVTTSIQISAPFIMKGINTIQAGDICQGVIKKIEIPMRLDPTATGGTYPLIISNKYLTSTFIEYSSSDTLNIFVSGTPQINANIVNSNPVDVYPGDTATLTINLENDGAFEAQSVNAKMTADEPLVMKWSKSYAAVGMIDARSSKNADFTVEVPKDAKIQDYPLTLTVEYLDEQNDLRIKTFSFNLHIKEKALFETSNAGSDSLYANQNSRIIKIALKNTGTASAYKITARMLPQFPFSTDGSVRYIDNIKPQESAQVNFVVGVDKDGSVGSYGLDMLLDFEDAQGKKLQDTVKVSLNVEKKNFIRYIFIDYWFIWAVVILIAIIIIRKKSKPVKK